MQSVTTVHTPSPYLRDVIYDRSLGQALFSFNLDLLLEYRLSDLEQTPAIILFQIENGKFI